jgi:hypothetical protein
MICLRDVGVILVGAFNTYESSLSSETKGKHIMCLRDAGTMPVGYVRCVRN